MFISSQSMLVDSLIKSWVLRTSTIIDAFQQVDRVNFVLENYRDEAYADYPLPIGLGQTISQPTTVAFMIELLSPKPGNTILDIGSGSGWTTTILASITGKTGFVTGIEIFPELVAFGKKNLAKYPSFNLNAIILQTGDRLGIPGNTFDRILVSAGTARFPNELLDQLNLGGRLVIPVGSSIFLYLKDSQWAVHTEEFPGFVFVPLKV